MKIQTCTLHFYFDLLSLEDFFLGEEKYSWLPSGNKVTDEKTEHCNLTRKSVCFHQPLYFWKLAS